MRIKTLPLQQLHNKMQAFGSIKGIVAPPTGWIKATRMALNMSLLQLGRKLYIRKQSAQALEEREKEGAITLKSLRQAADALDMQLVYGFVPKDGTLEALIDRKAKELAKKIVLRTSTSMVLEDQENSIERIDKAIEERAMEIKNEMPKALWD